MQMYRTTMIEIKTSMGKLNVGKYIALKKIHFYQTSVLYPQMKYVVTVCT